MDAETVLMLCNPEVPLAQSVTAAQNIMGTEPLLDAKLAALLPGKELEGEPCLSVAAALRVLDILDAISVGPRLVTALCRVARHPNPSLRSKVAIVIGRRLKNRDWTERRLLETDARVRANVIESLWHDSSPQCQSIFLNYRHDPHNRVAGNAIYGLYLLGHEEARQSLVAMAQHGEPRFRITAAWVIGKTGDLGLLDVLKPMLTDVDAKVRAAAFKALSKIRAGKVEGQNAAQAS